MEKLNSFEKYKNVKVKLCVAYTIVGLEDSVNRFIQEHENCRIVNYQIYSSPTGPNFSCMIEYK